MRDDRDIFAELKQLLAANSEQHPAQNAPGGQNRPAYSQPPHSPRENANARATNNKPPQGAPNEYRREAPSKAAMPNGDAKPYIINRTGGTMTRSLGQPIYNDKNSLSVGENGPVLLEDVQFLDKLAHFARERIPERVVHAKGAGAFGEFVCTKPCGEFTSAHFLQQAGRVTPVTVRFSTVVGGRGSADTVRDPRGFAVKFYTDEGIYDLVGNHLPVFFIRDAIQFPDVIHSLKPSPDTNVINPERFWDFISLTPESTNMITYLYSDEGTVKSFRHINGFGVNTYVWVNAQGVRKLVKFHWKSMQGLQTLNREEAARLAGEDPDVAVKDLYNAIAAGEYPQYELAVQMMEEDRAETLDFDPLDDTKIWPETMFPLLSVGKMTLNRNPENYFAQVEQAAFCPANIVNGVEFSADKMLQGRSFSYVDTQRHRIGPNFAQLPVNKSKSPVHNHQQDGSMAYDFNKGAVNYSPNSLDGDRPHTAMAPAYPGPMLAGRAERKTIRKTDDYAQAGEHYRQMPASQQAALCNNIAAELYKVKKDIAERVIRNFYLADKQFGLQVSERVKTLQSMA